jgi:hypothetical protein
MVPSSALANQTPDEPSGASGCSHGGDKRTAVPARSHDSALAKERRELWKNTVAYLVNSGRTEDSAFVMIYADNVLKGFDKRFGETAERS